MTTSYYRPLIEGPGGDGVPLAGGWARATRLARRTRTGADDLIGWEDVPPPVRDRLTAPRPPLWPGMEGQRPQVMGILNTTPDSFSDGGQFETREAARAQARAMVAAEADILDIGGESTRPGAAFVSAEAEAARVLPVIEALHADLPQTPLSIDTRKPQVAAQALARGAVLYNDVSALTYDEGAGLAVLRDSGAPICLMHASAPPDVMQDQTDYADVVLDVYDWLAARIALLEAHGIPRARIAVDPGIGFGKTLGQNLALLRNLTLFHGLGCSILLGASRKRFIGTLTGTDDAQARMPGSLAVALEAARQGVQILRVHDVVETVQALTLWQALEGGKALEGGMG